MTKIASHQFCALRSTTELLGVSVGVMFALSQGAIAQQLPDAGSQIQQIRPAPPPARLAPETSVQQVATPVEQKDDGVKVLVKRLQVSGSKVHSEAELLNVTGFKPGSELTLGQLRAMAMKIEVYLQKQGYFVAHAYLLAQQVNDGVVTISVVDGEYGAIVLRNSSSLSFSVAQGLLKSVQKGDVVSSATLERSLLLLSDVPGVAVKSTLVPGAVAGTSDLIVDVVPGRLITGNVSLDNQGNNYTGEYRGGATVNVNNPLGLGDVLSVRGLTSAAGLNYGRAAYQAQVGEARVGAAYTALAYRLDFQGIELKGTAKIASLYASYPIIRSRDKNLYVQVGIDSKAYRDRQPADNDKNATTWNASLTGDFRDEVGAGALNSYGLNLTSGNLKLRTPDTLALDDITNRSSGPYNKVSFNASRLQGLTRTVSASAALRGQWASKNLDSSEKLSLGGANGVRAYPEGEASGDQGYVLSLEGRVALPALDTFVPGQVQLVGFVDTGSITFNKNPWAIGPNRKTLSGAGVGLNWTVDNSYAVKGYFARKLGSEKALSAPDSSNRFWFELVKSF